MQAVASPSNEAARLDAVLRYQILDTPPEASFDRQVRLAAYIMGTPIALISILDNKRQWFKSRYGLATSETPREMSFCAHIALLDAPLLVRDATCDARFVDNPLVTTAPHIRFYAGVPLRTPDGFVLGALCAVDTQPRDVSQEQLDMLALLADQIMETLELRRQNFETTRAAAEQAEERAELRAMLDQVPGGVGFWTRELRNGYSNIQYARLFDRSRDELRGVHVREVFGQLAFDRAYPHMLGALCGEPQSFESIRTLEDGEQQEMHVEYTPFVYGGQVRGFISLLMDVKARNESARQLLRSQSTQRALLDALPGIVLQLSPDGCVSALYGQAGAHPLLNAEEACGRNWRDVLQNARFSHLRDRIEEAIRSAHAGKRIEVFEYALSAAGEIKHYEARVAPVSELFDTVLLVLDVTEKRRQEQALRDYAERLDGLINSALDGIVTLDERGNIEQVNPALEKLCGYSASELRSRSMDVLLPATTWEASLRQLLDVMSTGGGGVFMREVAICRKDGSQFFAEISISSFEFAGTRHFTAIVRDIQERKMIRARSEFIAMVSHELRTPLNTVVGLGEALMEDREEPLTARQRERAGTMLASSHHLSDLVKDILDVSRIELGTLRLDRAAISIGWLCDLAVAMVSDAAERKGVALRKNILINATELLVDRRRIMQILVNLLDNAVKFTPPEGEVQLIVRQGEAAIDFTVRDNGIGIAEEERERLFKPFSQVDATTHRKYQGTGLGLYLARRLAMLHGGDISVQSAPGRGSSFTLSLPGAITETSACRKIS